MKVSYNWLKEYLKCDLTPDQVAEAKRCLTAIESVMTGAADQV